ncbi:MAG: hypothetical protein CK427_06725 [Leptospira sp.]|nr:MAG: hypothetical protein CK427_06725 [Leptospira sp.]
MVFQSQAFFSKVVQRVWYPIASGEHSKFAMAVDRVLLAASLEHSTASLPASSRQRIVRLFASLHVSDSPPVNVSPQSIANSVVSVSAIYFFNFIDHLIPYFRYLVILYLTVYFAIKKLEIQTVFSFKILLQFELERIINSSRVAVYLTVPDFLSQISD